MEEKACTLPVCVSLLFFYFEWNNGNLIRSLWSYYKISEIMSRENILADFGFCRNLKSDQKLSEPNLFFFPHRSI